MPASTAKQAEVSERRANAIKMRIAGIDYQTIADQLGYKSRGAACQDVSRAFDRNRAEEGRDIERLRELELARYERAQAALWPKVLKGELAAIDTFIRLSARRARVLGLDVVQEIKVFTVDAIDAEIDRLTQELALAEVELGIDD